jgi:hypothetical protein
MAKIGLYSTERRRPVIEAALYEQGRSIEYADGDVKDLRDELNVWLHAGFDVAIVDLGLADSDSRLRQTVNALRLFMGHDYPHLGGSGFSLFVLTETPIRDLLGRKIAKSMKSLGISELPMVHIPADAEITATVSGTPIMPEAPIQQAQRSEEIFPAASRPVPAEPVYDVPPVSVVQPDVDVEHTRRRRKRKEKAKHESKRDGVCNVPDISYQGQPIAVAPPEATYVPVVSAPGESLPPPGIQTPGMPVADVQDAPHTQVPVVQPVDDDTQAQPLDEAKRTDSITQPRSAVVVMDDEPKGELPPLTAPVIESAPAPVKEQAEPIASVEEETSGSATAPSDGIGAEPAANVASDDAGDAHEDNAPISLAQQIERYRAASQKLQGMALELQGSDGAVELMFKYRKAAMLYRQRADFEESGVGVRPSDDEILCALRSITDSDNDDMRRALRSVAIPDAADSTEADEVQGAVPGVSLDSGLPSPAPANAGADTASTDGSVSTAVDDNKAVKLPYGSVDASVVDQAAGILGKSGRIAIVLPPEYVKPDIHPSRWEKLKWSFISGFKNFLWTVLAVVVFSLLATMFVNSDLGRSVMNGVTHIFN